MSGRSLLPALAICTAAGAYAAWPVPALALGLLGIAALWSRQVWLWCAVFAAVTSTLAASAWDGLDEPPPREVNGVATVVTDPENRYGAVHAELRVNGRRYDAWARGGAAGSLRGASAGDVLDVRGITSPLRGRIAPYLRRRHVVARLQVDAAGAAAPGAPLSSVANRMRRTIHAGAAVLGERRGLFGGFVLGDDREQDSATIDRFREAGLSHLLVVSGQNVAFALLLAAPLVARGAYGSRLAWTCVILIFFGTLVRWEPSVLRAVVMAGIAVLARTLAHPADRFQVLAAAVTIILVIDPLLVGSVSFLLSVGASAGIALLGPWFVDRLRGPRPFVEVLSATAGAQIGVAPVLLSVFGSMPIVSVPANLLAVPISGPLMMWGMVAGVPAGLAHDSVAMVLHWPTRVMLAWVDGVARWAAELGAPTVGPRGALAAALIAAVLMLARRSRGAPPAPAIASGREAGLR